MKKIKKKKDVGIYGVAAKWYDRNTRKTRLAEMRGYADEIESLAKPGGMSLIIDMNREATDEDINNQLQGTKGFDKYFVKFSFKTFLKQAAYTKNEFEALVQETPFRDYTIKTEGISIYVYLYK